MAPTALVVGEALIDEYPGERVVAGAPLHVSAHLVALGWRAMLLTRVGRDTDGERIVATCHDLGIDTGLIETDPALPTGTTGITLGDSGHTFDVRSPAAWDAIRGPDPVPAHDALIFGSLPLRHPTAAATVQRLVAASTGLVVVDANLRPPHIDREALVWAMGKADVLKMNQEEAREIGTASTGPTWVCVTRGADGAAMHHRDGRAWTAAAIATNVIDTVGAGDAFLAVLVDGLVAGDEPGAVLARANRYAAGVGGRRGGLPADPAAPTRHGPAR
ncbi:MAG: hypothetical protein HZA58_07385 [Acidimicrobiia bacterium]|nr:hypothetical protein [Acidimicrobiia bacterium]